MTDRVGRLIRRFAARPARRVAVSAVVAESRVEAAEPRVMLSALNITQEDQLLLELVNRARANPTAEARRYDISLNQGLSGGTISTAPKQPLAAEQALSVAARRHSADMLNRDFFAHNAPAPAPYGRTPQDRAAAAGYDHSAGENIGWSGTSGTLDREQGVYDRHERLFLSPGHRENIMFPDYKELGTGVRYGVFRQQGRDYNAIMVTEMFGTDWGREDNFLTGVVYTDSASGPRNDNFYSIGEAEGGGTITAHAADGRVYSVPVGASGGWSLQVPDGVYHVTLDDGGTRYIVEDVRVTGENEKVDFELGTASVGDVPRPRPDAGAAPLDVIARNANGTWIVGVGQPRDDGTGRLVNDGFGSWDGSVDWRHVSFGDFNGDGLTDAAGWDPATGDWSIGFSDGDQLVTSVVGRWGTGAGWRQVQVGDFNGDGLDDLAGRTRGGAWYVALSDGQSISTSRWSGWTANLEWTNIQVADFNGDGKDDLAGFNENNSWFLSRANSAGTRMITGYFGRWNPGLGWDNVVAADFTGDGRADLAATIDSGSLYVGRSTGTRMSTARWGGWQAGQRFEDVVAGDFDGDGTTDLAGRNARTGVWSVSRNTGANRFETTLNAGAWSAADDWEAVFAADYNGDGVDELIGFRADHGWFAGDPWEDDINQTRIGSFGTSQEWTDVAIGQFDAA